MLIQTLTIIWVIAITLILSLWIMIGYRKSFKYIITLASVASVITLGRCLIRQERQRRDRPRREIFEESQYRKPDKHLEDLIEETKQENNKAYKEFIK